MLTFIKKIVIHQKKDYLLLLSILTLIASFEFCFIAMYDHLSRLDLKIDWMTFRAIAFIPFLTLMIAVVLSVFVAKYFIQNKKHEFSMLLLFGRKPKDLFLYLIIQYGTMSLIAFFLGFILGILIMKGINIYLIHIHMNYIFQYHFLNTFFLYTFFLIFTVIFILAISAQQFTEIDTHIIETINHKNMQKVTPYMISMSRHDQKRKVPTGQIISSLFTLYIFFYSLYALATDSLFENKFIYFALFLISIASIINTFIPLLFDLFHSTLLHHPLLFNSISSFIDLTNQLVSIANIHSIVLPTMFILVLMSGDMSYITPFIIPCFIMMLIMLLLCFIIKYSLYIKSIMHIYATQYALGYSPSKLFQISIFKNLLFLILVIFIPFVYIYSLGDYIITHQFLTSQVMYSLECLYLVLYTLLMIYIILKERHCIKEVINNVKYLNRGE